MSVTPTDCRICRNSEGNRSFEAREMMFGWRTTFEYVECASCGCLQLIAAPDDLARYYQEGYYSFKTSAGPKAWKRLLRRSWMRHSTGQSDWLGAAIASVRGPMIPREWTSVTRATPDSSVLDVGCGAGGNLLLLREAGFTRLTGCDPFIERDFVAAGTIPIRKRFLRDMDGTYDLVMMHHSFEHMDDPHAVLSDVVRLLNPGGWCLIRIPVASSRAWKTYGIDWVQLDAPRHFFLHTVASVALLAQRSGLRLARTIHDSTDFQFWASEQYRQGVPLFDARSYMVDRSTALFDRETIETYRRRAGELNATGEGDQACFYLCKPA